MIWESVILIIVAYAFIGYVVSCLAIIIFYYNIEGDTEGIQVLAGLFFPLTLFVLFFYGIYKLVRLYLKIFLAPKGSKVRKIQKIIVFCFVGIITSWLWGSVFIKYILYGGQ